MNTSDIIDRVAGHGMTKAQAKQVVDAVFAAIAEAAKKGDEVSVPGFGKFKVQAKPARTGRNPRTGESMQIAASKKIAFQPAKAFKDSVNG